MISLEKLLSLANVTNLTTLIKGYVDQQISALAASVQDIFGDVNTSLETLETEMDNKAESGHTHTNYASTVTTSGSGNAITAISQNGNTITATKGSTFLTAHPTISKSMDSTSTASPAHGEMFTVVDSATRDSNGHVTKVNVKQVTLPSETNLSKGENDTATKTLSHGGTFTAVTGTSVDGHEVTDTVTKFTMPTETTLSTGSATDSSSLSHSGTFTAVTDITVSGHKITPTTTTYTLPSDADTKNTAGSSNTSSKIFLVGATSQAANPVTYSHDTAYVGTDGCVYSGSKKTATVDQILKFSDVSVATTAWASDTTYSDYPYRASVTCTGVTADHVADVAFAPTEASIGNYAEVCQTAANTVYIYAVSKPTAAITIPTIEARKAVV